MHAHSPGSYGISLLLHGAVVIALLASAYYFHDARKKNTNQIIELVAGPGDNYMATEAPAGVPDVSFTPPVNNPPRPEPVVEPTPVTPVAPPVTPPKSTTVVQPPKPKVTPKPKPQERLTAEEFQKKYGKKNKTLPSSKVAKNQAKPKPVTPKKIGKGVKIGVVGGTGSAAGAGGTALTAAERNQMDAYFALLAQRIREAQEKPAGLSSELVVRVEFQVYANGNIGAVKVIRSSGNRAFDDSVLKAIRSVRSIGDRPDGKSGAKTADFRMREED